MIVASIRRELRQQANPARARISQRFFKTGPGEYGAGDRFVGLTVPQIRRLAQQYRLLPPTATQQLLQSPIHEERLLALLILVDAFAAADGVGQEQIYKIYLQNTQSINNWDLVDTSAPLIVGAFLWKRSKAPLRQLARSANLWERRIAMVATLSMIRRGEFGPTLRLARQLLVDREDLIHKAVGWMLREVGKRNRVVLEKFLRRYYRQMPRTMLRYAIEHFPKRRRLQYLRGGAEFAVKKYLRVNCNSGGPPVAGFADQWAGEGDRLINGCRWKRASHRCRVLAE